MSLKSLIDNERTDKDTTHSYIDLYDKILAKRKETAFNILEIGIYLGGSIKLWADYFTYATIYGLDTMPIDYVWNGIRNKKILFYIQVQMLMMKNILIILYYKKILNLI